MASKSSPVSRRGVLKAAGAAAVASGASALLGRSALAAQQSAPAVLTNAQGGRKFRAFVKFSNDPPSVQTLTVRALTGREVLIRTEAAQTCYSNADQVLLPGTLAERQDSRFAKPVIVGHGGVGIVEAIGPQVVRCQVGDQVVSTLHRSCGSCHNCLRMRADKCLSVGQAPTCDMADGTPVTSATGAMSELMLVQEEYAVPVFTKVSAPELAMLTCVGGCGLGMTMTNVPVDVASDVVIFGAGPIGLSAVQGAKLKGATQIIVVEPVRYRREIALKLGATAVVDPNQYNDRKRRVGVGPNGDQFTDSLVEHLREMCKKPTDRVFCGGATVGPDHVIEAVGGDRMKPKVEQGPDPTGVTVLEQCWDLCSAIGTLATCSVGHPAGAEVKISASWWADGAKHHWPGTGGGTNDRRDIPRYARLIQSGQLNMKALVGKTYPLNQTTEAYQACADRTVVATVVTPNA